MAYKIYDKSSRGSSFITSNCNRFGSCPIARILLKKNLLLVYSCFFLYPNVMNWAYTSWGRGDYTWTYVSVSDLGAYL